MHCFLVDGAFTKDVDWFFSAVKAEPATQALGPVCFKSYLKAWTWPKGYADASKMADDSKSISGTASEYLSLGPVLTKYVQSVVEPVAP